MKSPPMAGGLNIQPGFGNFYLAYGTDESEQSLVGFVKLLLCPVSVVWGIPEAAADAGTINKRETVHYFMKTEFGREELQAELDRQKNLPPIRR